MSKVSIIGSGFSGLSAACVTASKGYNVKVFEKNDTIGGRARSYESEGFTFDMGPSWYWMPDVFERFFGLFDKSHRDYYQLVLLDPGFQIFFDEKDTLQVPANLEALYEMFEDIETGSAAKLKKFLSESAYKYELGMQQLVFKPSISWSEYLHWDLLMGIAKSRTFSSVRSYVRSYFKDERLVALMEFPVLFLGAMPQQIPSLYTLMNYAALKLGTWYPMGGMFKIIDGMKQLAESYGVEFLTNNNVEHINVSNRNAYSLITNTGEYETDGIIASADYNHVEEYLLNKEYRNYSKSYWNGKTLAPSCVIYYLGISKKIKKLIHHNLFFDTSFEQHAKEIYENEKWPEKPLFYVCCPSKTDPSVAPLGMENLFILIPIAAGLEETTEQSEKYFNAIIERIEKKCEDSILPYIIYKRTYSLNDFKKDYNAYKGNAYGLANTLQQTAAFKPSIKNKKIDNLFYAGQLTVPGPGVPPSIISGQIAANQIYDYLKK